MELVTKTDIIDAADRIKDSVLRTPLVRANVLGRELWLKPENLQFIGAFKVRGAANVLAQLPESAKARVVVAYSGGNHAQAVAYAARQAGVSALIVIDDTAPELKLAATRALGAEVRTVPLTQRQRGAEPLAAERGAAPGAVGAEGRPGPLAQRQRVAEQLPAERGATLIPPFDHPGVIAGQGTI